MKKSQKGLLDILELNGYTPFEISVYRATCSIPWGETRTYRWVARKAGRPSAIRAVGGALNKNPFPLAIPCHRVIRSNGSTGGFSSGECLKKRLLKHEVAVIMKKRKKGDRGNRCPKNSKRGSII